MNKRAGRIKSKSFSAEIGPPSMIVVVSINFSIVFFERCEVLRVLLLLLIEPGSMSSLPPDLTVVLDKYAWESEDVAAAEEASRFLSEDVSCSAVRA